MNYIYDIILNFNDNLIDFFEWDKGDSIVHIKKMPIFKISIDSYENINIHEIYVDESFLKSIFYKTEMWNNNKKKDDLYYCLLSDGNSVIALKFDKYGKCIKRSSLYIDEELETLEICERLEIKNINFKIGNKIVSNFKTRNELKTQDFLLKELNTLNKNKDYNKIKYLYFECFNKEENNIDKAILEIKQTIKHNKKNKELFNIFKLISINNK